MLKTKAGRIEKDYRGVAVGLAIVLLGLGGCAGETQKAVPPTTQDHVREHSEKTFHMLKQEEKDRAVRSAEDH